MDSSDLKPTKSDQNLVDRNQQMTSSNPPLSTPPPSLDPTPPPPPPQKPIPQPIPQPAPPPVIPTASPAPTSPPASPPAVTPPATSPSPAETHIPLQQPSEDNVGIGTPNIGVEEKQAPKPITPEPSKEENEYINVQEPYSQGVNTPLNPTDPPNQTNNQPVQIKNYQNPDNQNQSGLPQPPVKAKGSNASLVAFIILSLVLGSAGGFFGFRYFDQMKTSASTEPSPVASQSPTLDLNDWIDYTSNLYNFSLKYPIGWFASSTEPKAETLTFASDNESLSGEPTGYKIDINFQNSNDQTLKKWVEANTVTIGEKNPAKEITVSGQTAYQQEITKSGHKVATYIERPSKIMVVTYSAPEKLFTEGGEWYNKMINSINLN